MPKTSHLPPISSEPNSVNQYDALHHQREWQAHVDAGGIGSRSTQTPKQRRIHARNEMILCGYRVFPKHDDSGEDASSQFYRGFVG